MIDPNRNLGEGLVRHVRKKQEQRNKCLRLYPRNTLNAVAILGNWHDATQAAGAMLFTIHHRIRSHLMHG